jgi:hypothetical protein
MTSDRDLARDPENIRSCRRGCAILPLVGRAILPMFGRPLFRDMSVIDLVRVARRGQAETPY